MWGSVPGRRHGESTGPEVRVRPVHAQKSEEAGVVRAECGGRGQLTHGLEATV